MDKLLTVDHVSRIVRDCGGCNPNCKKLVNRVCPQDCEILQIKYKLSAAKEDAVLVAVDASFV